MQATLTPRIVLPVVALMAATPALADITVGVIASLTGPAAALGAESHHAVPDAPRQQADAHHAIADDHHRREDSIPGQTPGLLAAGEHHRDDQGHLDDRHCQGQDQGAQGLADAMGNDLRVIHRHQHRRD